MTNKGTITSTNYPNNYEKDQTCEWLLEVPEDHTMTITINDVDLYTSDSCTESELKVGSGIYWRSIIPSLITFVIYFLLSRSSMAIKTMTITSS